MQQEGFAPKMTQQYVQRQKDWQHQSSDYFKSMIRFVTASFMIMTYQLAAGQSSVYFGEKEVTPKIPAKNERLRVIIVSDATNEIDDVWAISLAILSPERFDIEGFVGSNYDHTHSGVGPKSIEMSVNEIHVQYGGC